jgi:hypothetical protein
MTKLIMEIFDGAGNLVERHESECEPVTQEEIDDAVDFINHGCDARTAMMLAKQGRPPEGMI